MADLTHTSQTIKKIGPLLLIFSIIALLIGIIVYRLTKGPEIKPPAPISPPIINQNPDQQQPRQFDFSDAQTEHIPEMLPIYSISPYSITETTATTLASNLGFQGNPSPIKENTLDGSEFNWTLDSSRLTISQTNIEYRNLNDQSQNQANTTDLTLDQLQEQTNIFIGKIGILGGDLKLQKTEFPIISEGLRTTAKSFEQAQIIEFSYTKGLPDLPLVDNSPASGFTTVRITKKGKVIYLSSRFFDKFSEASTYKLKAAEEAKKEVQNGQGKIIQALLLNESEQPVISYEHAINIEKAYIKRVSLAYFLPNDIKDTVQPIFVFEGSFKTNKNENGKVVIYLPAIKQTK